jgi:hypothetical protein
MSDDENDPWSENPFAPENADNVDEDDFTPQNMSSYFVRKPRAQKKLAKKPTWTEQVKEFFSEEPPMKKTSKRKSTRKPVKKSSKKASKKKMSKKKLSSYAKNKTSKDFYKHHPAQRKR